MRDISGDDNKTMIESLSGDPTVLPPDTFYGGGELLELCFVGIGVVQNLKAVHEVKRFQEPLIRQRDSDSTLAFTSIIELC